MIVLVLSMRGLAKSGSYEPDQDYNLVDLSERNRSNDAR